MWFGAQDGVRDRALQLLEQGRTAEAIPLLERAAEADGKNAIAWKALGVAYASLKDYTAAEPAFGKACRLAPQLADACYFHARALYALDRFEESLAALSRVGAGWRIRLAAGQALEGLGRREEAEKSLRDAVAQVRYADPGPGVALGLFLLRSGRATEAQAPLEEVAGRFPNSADAHTILARVLLERNAFDQAVPHLERALALQPDSSQAHLLLARAYVRQGRTSDAQPHFDAAARGTVP